MFYRIRLLKRGLGLEPSASHNEHAHSRKPVGFRHRVSLLSCFQNQSQNEKSPAFPSNHLRVRNAIIFPACETIGRRLRCRDCASVAAGARAARMSSWRA